MGEDTDMKAGVKTAARKYVCASERVKLIGTLDGLFPDFGHHEEKEMGGLWLHPIKLLDGFWLRFCDHESQNVNTWIIADSFENQPEGSHFLYRGGLGHTPVVIDRYQLAPEKINGLIVTYSLRNSGSAPRKVSLEFLAQTDMRPVWFSNEANIVCGERDEGQWDTDNEVFQAKDNQNQWYTAIGCDQTPDDVIIGEQKGPQNTNNKGIGVSFFFSLSLAPEETKTLTVFIAGSYTSKDECLTYFNRLKCGGDFLGQKKERYSTLLASSRLRLSDERFCELFDWVKVNTDWLIQDSGPYGRGLTAGLPEYAWWFGCDNCYALQGVLAMGNFQLVRDTLELLLTYSERFNGNGRILHEVTTFGVCANPGNTQETAHFLIMVFLYYQWTGDLNFLKRTFPYLSKSVDWLVAQDGDHDLFPSGYGIIEIAGLHSELIDSAVYTAKSFACYADICRLLGEAEKADRWEKRAQATKNAINEKFWDTEEGLYCDVYSSYAEVFANKESILGRIPLSQKENAHGVLAATLEKKKQLGEAESGWIINRNWVINTPMEMGIAPPEHANVALARMHTDEFIGTYGMYLSALAQSSIMTISTGAMAVAQARYGYADRALDLVRKIFSTFSLNTPGGISEMSPDYGCFVQAWTAYAVMVPIVMYFFGVKPDMRNNRIVIAPCMPEAWKQATLEQIRLPGGTLTLAYSKRDDCRCYVISGACETPLYVSLPPNQRWRINNEEYAISSEPQLISIEPLS
jgi:hypothetical protein